MTLIGIDIEVAANLLKNDNVVAIPTETVYGLAGNALSISAVTKIYEIKDRPFTHPLIIHLPDTSNLSKYVKNIPAIAIKLAEHFWPGPLTLLLPKTDIIPDIVTSGLPDVAVRIPNHPVAIQLLRKLSFPLAAPSANPYGYISPTNPEHVNKQLSGKIPYILDGGICMAGIESTIVGFENGIPVIYRVGAIAPEAIKKVAGRVEIKIQSQVKPLSPGMSCSHYSPRTPLFLTNNIEALPKTLPRSGTGILSFKNLYPFILIPENRQEILSYTGNLEEAAHNLYKALHRLDSLGLERIIAESVPNTGLGIAINDRLSRSTQKTSINDDVEYAKQKK